MKNQIIVAMDMEIPEGIRLISKIYIGALINIKKRGKNGS